jgi:tetratricopeptide (TPR) repeat protein
MSRRLALLDTGLELARYLARKGRRKEALSQALQLLRRPDLSLAAAADAHRVAGELYLDNDCFSKARRHFRQSLTIEPGHARTRFLAGLAFERDPDGDDYRAACSFLKASTLTPENAAYRAAFGRAAIRCDRVQRGVRELNRAAEAGLKDLTLLEVVIEGLLEAGKVNAANRIIVKARFSCLETGGIRRLQDRVRYESARRSQRRGRNTQDAGPATDGAVRLLPFLRVVRSSPGGTMPPANVRRDVASFPRPHLGRLRMRSDH